MLDSYGRKIEYLRISVTDLCNYRCVYCMEPEGVPKRPHAELLRLEEIVELAAAAADCGIRKLRLTGGEPLVRPGIVELCQMLDWTITADSPCVIRYPKSGPVFDRKDFQDADSFVPGIWRCVRSGQDLALLATGSMLIHALRTAELLASHGKQCAVWNCSSIKPADQNALVGIANAMPFFTLEEHMRIGGFGEYVTSLCAERRCPIPLHCFAIEGELPAHGEHTLLIREAGLNSQCMAERILKMIKECIR